MMICLPWLVWPAVLLTVAYATVADRARLKRFLLENYRPDIRPVESDDKPTNVTVSLALRQILEMDMRSETLKARMYIHMKWTDELLMWNSSEYGGVDSIHLYANSIWTPDIIMYNEVTEHSFLNEMRLTLLRVHHTGIINWPSPITTLTSCPLNMKYFPWDEQLCSWHLGSWVYPLHEVDIHPLPDPNSFVVEFVEHGEWEVLEKTATRQISSEGIGLWQQWPTITFSVRLKRRPLFFVVNMIIPSMMITALCLLAFCVPSEAGEKITVTITVLLASTVFLLVVNDIMPVQSYEVPAISEFYLTVMTCLALATIATVFVTSVHHRGSSGQRMSPWVRKFTKYVAKCVCMRIPDRKFGKTKGSGLPKEEKEDFNSKDWSYLANCLDRLFFVVFSILFLICFMVTVMKNN